jgi:hypothetical protein
MNDQQRNFLTVLRQPPPRLTAQQTAWALNCQEHDIPALIAAKLLKPLGSPPANGVKYFCTQFVLERSKDTTWLARITNAIHEHWRRKNAAKKSHPANGRRSFHREEDEDGLPDPFHVEN